MVFVWLSLVIAAVCLLFAPSPAEARPPAAAVSGRIKLLTYNVAGLPEGISQSRPSVNLPKIGGLLNRYDLALVQEDFAYPDALRKNLRLPYASAPFARNGRLDFGDGLSQFSRWPLGEPQRSAWTQCNGITDAYFDCLTPKGFTRSRLELVTGAPIDVYNLHMDAGRSAGDRAARVAQLDQLAEAIRAESAGHAVIVAGDFNLSRSERDLLARFEERTELRDACTVLACPEPGRIDRVLFRSSGTLRLDARRWSTERGFVDAQGRPLSDHLPVVVELAWRRPPHA